MSGPNDPRGTGQKARGNPPICDRCGGSTFERLQRTSFLQRKVLPFFVRYPWRCVFCNKLSFRSARNHAELNGGGRS